MIRRVLTALRRRWKLWLLAGITLSILVLSGTRVFMRSLAGPHYAPAEIAKFGESESLSELETLKVMTLNVAHGRANGPNQLFLSTDRITANLDVVADLIRREGPHVVAFQEIDSPSFWTGNMNQLAVVCRRAELAEGVQGRHVDDWGLHYGAAIGSVIPIRSGMSHTFESGAWSFPKGFVAVRMTWPGTDVEFDVISCHLDFLMSATRLYQMNELTEYIENRSVPVIVMGDFNTLNTATRQFLGNFRKRLGLSTVDPDSKSPVTYPALGVRLDWIMVSNEFEILRHAVLPDIVADHLALVAEIRLRSEP